MNTPFYVFMKLLPKNAASRAFGIVTRLRIPFVSKALRNVFANYYRLNMEESEYPLSHYRNIGELFIRRLKPGARPIADSEIVLLQELFGASGQSTVHMDPERRI